MSFSEELHTELEQVEHILTPPQTATFDHTTHTVITAYLGNTPRIHVPPGYPHTSRITDVSLHPSHGPTMANLHGILSDAGTGEYVLVPLCMAFRASLEPSPYQPKAKGGGGRSTPPPSKEPKPAKSRTTPPPQEEGSAKVCKAKVGSKGKDTPPPQQTLTSSDRIFNRIMWDSAFQARDFEVGYEDRFKGTMWTPFGKFRKGDDPTKEIPFHRVTFFRYQGREIVWDRAQRIDRLDELAERHAGQEAVAPTLASVELNRTLEDIECLEPSTGQAAAPAAPYVGQRCTVMTWNVLFDHFDGKEGDLRSAERIPLFLPSFRSVLFLEGV